MGLSPPPQGESMAAPPGDSEKPDSATLPMESVRAAVLRRPGVPPSILGERLSRVVSVGPGERLPRSDCPPVSDSVRFIRALRGGERCRSGEVPRKWTRVLSAWEDWRDSMRKMLVRGSFASSALALRPQHMRMASSKTSSVCSTRPPSSQGAHPLPREGWPLKMPHKKRAEVVVVVVLVRVVVSVVLVRVLVPVVLVSDEVVLVGVPV
mmetsp:Transcript_1966/g.6543  ORF Transcript_1966/g.6543 Transcript_1966/m.6543 type:complete len:209 (-) Transcript_1966:1218-1844(-)